jgi:hypothetical protein
METKEFYKAIFECGRRLGNEYSFEQYWNEELFKQVQNFNFEPIKNMVDERLIELSDERVEELNSFKNAKNQEIKTMHAAVNMRIQMEIKFLHSLRIKLEE